MPPSVHQRRDRAESFGAVAQDYDRYRPGYPDELIEDLVALAGGGPVLDIGIGTGKAARLLADRGLDVLGVEPDPLMAEVARGHGLTVETGRFESWPDAGRTFPLITAAQAWHWVDPVPGAPKVARLLRAGGTFAPFWNFEALEDRVLDALEPAYRQFAPEIDPRLDGPRRGGDESPYVTDLRASGAFASVTTHVYSWSRSYPVQDWLGRVSTQSVHLLMGPARLAALMDACRATLTELGPEVRTTGGTYLIDAKVAR